MISEIKCEYVCGIFKALGHPVRLKIVNLLLENNGCFVNKIAETMCLPQSTTSQHIAVLKNNKIVSSEKKGVDTRYFVSNEKIQKLIAFMKE